MFSEELLNKAETLLEACRRRKILLATAESCTGGLIAAVLTEVPGSSDVVERGLVTYHNDAKKALLGVPQEVLDLYGAVSEQTALMMAKGLLEHAPVELTISVTGIAGPGGAVPGKPVGTVHLACAAKDKTPLQRAYLFKGDRQAVRMAAVEEALELMREQLENDT